jgi:hypothetical protein
MATQPPFFMKIAMSDLENSHERPFSIILVLGAFGFRRSSKTGFNSISGV